MRQGPDNEELRPALQGRCQALQERPLLGGAPNLLLKARLIIERLRSLERPDANDMLSASPRERLLSMLRQAGAAPSAVAKPLEVAAQVRRHLCSSRCWRTVRLLDPVEVYLHVASHTVCVGQHALCPLRRLSSRESCSRMSARESCGSAKEGCGRHSMCAVPSRQRKARR